MADYVHSFWREVIDTIKPLALLVHIAMFHKVVTYPRRPRFSFTLSPGVRIHICLTSLYAAAIASTPLGLAPVGQPAFQETIHITLILRRRNAVPEQASHRTPSFASGTPGAPRC